MPECPAFCNTPRASPWRARVAGALLGACAVAAGGAQAQCSSDGAPPVRTLVERFTRADCEECWTRPSSPLAPGPAALVVDWIVPGAGGDAAALSAAALAEAQGRLADLGRAAPADDDVHITDLPASARPHLRVAQGPAVADYLGSVVQLAAPPRNARARGPYLLSVAMVESVPPGTEGSPIARSLARGFYQVAWPALPAAQHDRPRQGWLEVRPMRIPEDAQPERLRVVAWLHDASGRPVAAAQTRCN